MTRHGPLTSHDAARSDARPVGNQVTVLSQCSTSVVFDVVRRSCVSRARPDVVLPPTHERLPRTVLADMMTFLAAVLAGIGGTLAGVKGGDALNRMLGRDAPAGNQAD